jgi:hypothetical protein
MKLGTTAANKKDVLVGFSAEGLPEKYYELNENSIIGTAGATNGVVTGATSSKDVADATFTNQAELGIIVVAHRLKAAGLKRPDIIKIFKNGITPTSLAAIESQLKGHHDAVLQIALETLMRVTQLMQKIAQKLSAS